MIRMALRGSTRAKPPLTIAITSILLFFVYLFIIHYCKGKYYILSYIA